MLALLINMVAAPAFSEEIETREWKQIRDIYFRVHSNAQYEWVVRPEYIDLGHCGAGFAIGQNDRSLAIELGFTEKEADKITYWAHELAFAAAALGKSPYTGDLWKDIIDGIEISKWEREGQSGFEFVIQDPDNGSVEVTSFLVYELDRLINRRAQKAGLNGLPPLQSSDECGGGEVPVEIKLVPDGARVWYTSDFGRTRCGLKNKPQDDVIACASWLEVTGKVPSLAGIVHFQARWPDGDLVISRQEIKPDDPVVLIK